MVGGHSDVSLAACATSKHQIIDQVVATVRGQADFESETLQNVIEARQQVTNIELDADDGRLVWVPAGFAHGFCTMAPDTVVAYKVTEFYAPEAERTIRFDDPELGISWPVAPENAVLSDKDAQAPGLTEILKEIDA